MIDLLFASPAVWFTIPAMIGTLFFVLRLIMALSGLDGIIDGADGGADAGDFGDADVIDAGVEEGIDHAETTSVFKFISLQTVTAFAMGFGWGGLLGLHTLGLDLAPAIGVAVLIGFAFAWFIVWLLKLMYAMESSGNVGIRDTLGCEGVVSSSIPADDAGTGRVRVTVNDRQRSYLARSDAEEIQMGTHVRVIRANSDNTLTVTRV